MEPLLDTSWTLHYITKSSSTYHNLFTNDTTQNHLSRYFDRLAQYITTQKQEYKDDFNDETEKLGALRDINYTIHPIPHSPSSYTTSMSKSPTHLIHLHLHYQHTTFPITLYTPHLLLTKAPTQQTKLITTFLTTTFNIDTDQMKLPSSLLLTSLQHYISTLTSPSHLITTSSSEYLIPETRASILKSALGTLKLTISFSGPVSPHLKTLDLSIPYDSVDALVSKAARSSQSQQPNRNDNEGFMQQLVEHIHLQTGLKLSLTSTNTTSSASSVNDLNHSSNEPPSSRSGSVISDPGTGTVGIPLRLTKMTTAAFAISVEGKLRFAARAIDNAIEHEDLVIAANIGMLNEIVQAVIENEFTE